MGKRITVQVTQDDINWGKANDSHRCMVARAIARVVPGATNVEIDTASIRYSTPEGRYWWATPLLAMQYVSDFDLGVPRGTEMIPGEQIGPFSFQLRDVIRKPSRRLTAKGKAATKARNASLAAVREDHGLTDRQWRALSPAEKQERIAESRARGIDYVSRSRAVASPAHPEEAGEGDEPMVASLGTGRATPPRVFRTSRRMYGHRLLRWNQENPDPSIPAMR